MLHCKLRGICTEGCCYSDLEFAQGKFTRRLQVLAWNKQLAIASFYVRLDMRIKKASK